MWSNRKELLELPDFAQRFGAAELDVRYVTESPGVDNRGELLSGEDPAALRAELAAAARDAVRRGIRLASYPEFEVAEELRPTHSRAWRAGFWRIRAGIDRAEFFRHAWRQRLHGCAYPGHYFVVRPNGAVNPCIYWEGDPIGFYPPTTPRRGSARPRRSLASATASTSAAPSAPARPAASAGWRSTDCPVKNPPPARPRWSDCRRIRRGRRPLLTPAATA